MTSDAAQSLRQIRHPGPVAPLRSRAVPCRVRPLRLTLEPEAGETILDTVSRTLREAGYAAGYVSLQDTAMARMNYVIPAASPDDSHAAWYSATHEGGPGSRIARAGLHLGQRDGAPFLHCHGIWTAAGAAEAMGHLLPFEAELAGPVDVDVLAISGAQLVTRQDAETNFPLFSPEYAPPAPGEAERERTGSVRGLLLTIRPNVDVCAMIAQACEAAGFGAASILGIGSLVGADYEDGTSVSSYATEVLVRSGSWRRAEGTCLDIALVGLDGAISSGILRQGSNPVCVTFELLLTEVA
jgi:predicted DNA-binding protein with PD1-like motif